MLLECVVNVSEGRDEAVLAQLAAAAGPALLDQHRDPDHNRTVFTLAGPADLVAEASRALATATLAHLDLAAPPGAHPRLGVLDVVPFVPYEPGRPAPEDLDRRGGPARPLRPLAGHGDGGAELPLRTPSRRPDPDPARGPPPGLRAAARRVDPRPRPGRRPTPGTGPPPSAPGGSWWPTTSGSPRPRWPAGWRPWCGGPRCGRWAWPSGRGPRSRATWSTRTATGPQQLYDAVAALADEAGGTRRRGRAGGAHPRGGPGRRAPRQASRARPVGGGDGGVPAPRMTCRSMRSQERLGCSTRRWPRPGGPGHGPGAGGGAPARSCRPRCRTSRRWPRRTRGSPHARRTAADLFGLAGGRAALREEQIGVDPHAVGLQLPASFLATVERGDYVNWHWVRPPSSPQVALV